MSKPTLLPSSGQCSAEDATQRHWDVIVIGTGMGGGLAGRRLADHGLTVLFIEKGPIGHRSEEHFLRDDIEDYEARRLRGLWPTKMEARIDGGPATQFFGPIGSGVGGTSSFYAAAMEWPERHDLEDVEGFAHPTGGWPIGFDAFLPSLLQAADLLSVRGEADPLSDRPRPAHAPPPLSEAEEKLFDDLRNRGLHPYRSHEAIRRLPGCNECLGRKCPRPCKMDGRSAGVEPALATGNARLLADCAVEELIETAERISGVRVNSAGREFMLQADIVVLAAGALHSPRLLLGSKGTHAAGCANSSGWVGRGLMLHMNEIFALWPKWGNPAAGATRAVAFRDFYTHQGNRLGLVQSMGLACEAGWIAHYLKGLTRQANMHRIPGIGKLCTLVAIVSARIFGKATVFVGVLEDLAYFDNRVLPHPDDAEIPLVEYSFRNELKARRSLFRHVIRKKLGRYRTWFLGTSPTLNYGHPSGTLRFGADPSTSVLDANCKAHDLDNLFVVDASFMPSSMGVNPSLMIAANALRVADVIAARFVSLRQKAS